VARKPGGRLEPRAASEVARTRNIAGPCVWRILIKPHIFPLCMIRSIARARGRYGNERAHCQAATAASPIIIRATSVAQHRAISKEADLL
jgi:hypothetical protein